MSIPSFAATILAGEKARLPGFTAEFSTWSTGPYLASGAPARKPAAGVVAADSQTCNCNCGGGAGSGGTGGQTNPGVCACSSLLGAACSTTSNSCNPGFVPACNCGVLGNSCQCVPGGS